MAQKMKIVYQQDSKDCGACSLKSIVEYYGGYVSLEKIREHTYTTVEGTSIFHLVQAAKKYGFDAIAKKYLDNQITSIKLPAIVHVKYKNGLTHFMCLYEVNDDKLLVMDPAKGKVTMSNLEFREIFTGAVVELSLKSEIIILPKESSIYMLFINIIKSNKKLCCELLFSSIIFTILTIVSGFYFKIGFENIQSRSFISSLNIIIYLFLIVCVFKILFEYLKNYYENHINKNIDVSIIGNFISHIFNLPLKVINQRSTGEIISRINEMNSIKELFSKIFVSCFLELILSLGSILILFYINKTLTLILCLVMFLYILISLIMSPYLYKRIRQNIDYETEVNTALIEDLNMINSIKNLNRTSCVLDNLENKISLLLYDNYDFTNVFNALNFIKNFVCELGVFIINTLGFYQIINGSLSLVNLIVFDTLMSYFINPIKNIESLIPKYNFLRASFRKICDFIDLEEEKLGYEQKFSNGDIEFKNVDFSYNGYSKVLNNLNLRISKGDKVAIKGESGCGKSTVCKLLHKMYNPSSGNILINGKNILDYSILTIRKNIVYVSQKECLFNGTIKDNLAFYGNLPEDFEEICKICLVDNIVNKKSFRYDFGIDNNFANLSGGEKQRIVLARALFAGGDILILDEALSELDIKTERKIIKNVIEKYPKKTVIYITHKNHDYLFNKVIYMEKTL